MSELSGPPGELGWNLGTVLRGYQRLLEDAVADVPCGVRGFQVLSTVIHRDPPSQQALGAHLSIDRTVLTYLLDELVEAGIVERVLAPTDRRARKVVATPAGVELLTRYEERVSAAEQSLLESLDAECAREFVKTAGALAMNVHRAYPGSNPCEAMDQLD